MNMDTMINACGGCSNPNCPNCSGYVGPAYEEPPICRECSEEKTWCPIYERWECQPCIENDEFWGSPESLDETGNPFEFDMITLWEIVSGEAA